VARNITAANKHMVLRVVTDKGDMVAHEGLIHPHLKAIEDYEKDNYVNVDMDKLTLLSTDTSFNTLS